ncbi:ABC-three component system middle component 1 [Vibrio crassostreae]|uniref:ABC-three component system middle component 1 n=1 Tax=Vibrio crassostreae TaxID=246167 RepID=UPI000F4A4293|nr:ABC-three component system middle component 1 [Vibrio crassostreae]ROR20620.1 hypothetical protein EDB67_1147 [Vibrio crassostreae]TCW22318.1 hypothetical protein EDB48_101196 [Vibrio crassostreae]CAK3446792.1 conserved hypothetical protein [Vibrio crassostreae]
MIDIIEAIFKDFNYSVIESKEIKLYKSDTIDDYWVIFAGSPNELLSKRTQSRIMSLCKKSCKDSALDKNTNILCLWEIDKLSPESLRQLHEAEEDIYFFKKNVLYYSKEELSDLQSQLTTKPMHDILRFATDDPRIFKHYKENYSAKTWQALIYRIFIKITFIPVNQKSGEDISNLHYNHDESLKNNLQLEKLDAIIQDINMDNISNDASVLLNTIASQLFRGEK